MKFKSRTYSMAVADDNGICASQTPAAGGVQSLTLNGALVSGGVATMDVPRILSVTSAGDDSGRTFTFTGTDRHGFTITEEVTGGNVAAAYTTKCFKTITGVTTDDDTAGAVIVGTSDAMFSGWHNVDRSGDNYGFSVEVSAGASLKYQVQYTRSDIFLRGFRETDAVVTDITGILDASSDGVFPGTVRAVRVRLLEYASGSIKFNFFPPNSSRLF
jgi:hypothetical protein